jgi:alpha-galactosidase
MTHADLLWNEQRANLELTWPDGPHLRGLSAEVHTGEGILSLPGDIPHCQISAEKAVWQLEQELQVTWHWQTAEEGWDVWLSVTNTGQRAIRLEALDPLRVLTCDVGLAEPVFYQHGWNSWSPTFARHPDGTHYVDPGTPYYQTLHQPHYRPGQGGDFISEWVTVIRSSTSLLAGFVTAAHQLASLQFDEPRLVARCWLDGIPLEPGQTLRSERLWLKAGTDPVALLEDWAGRTGREMGARLGRRPPTGWCTWYHFFGTDQASDTENNLAFIGANDLPLDVILVDDGYQTAIGDWLSVNEKFPQGMRALADRMRAAGRQPGIWTAPFGAAADSRLFVEHPDWFIRDEEGEPVVAWRHHLTTDCYALDPTHPGAAAWLDDTFRALRWEWGYEFFKIDFIFAAAVPGRRSDPTATRATSLRRGVEIIRQAIGDEAFLLGCGAPQGVCVGLVDGMRVGPDVAPYWSSPWQDLTMPAHLNALRNSIARAPLHERLWLNDPDCLIVRRQGNASSLSLDEVRSQVALTALLGGLTLDSDDLTGMQPGRLKYLRQALPPTGVSARPLDMFEHELPRTLVLPVEREWGRWWVVAWVNWKDTMVEPTLHLADLGLPPERYHVYHYWRRRYLGQVRDEIAIPRHLARGHETLVLLFKPVSERPDFLTSTFHVCQGMVEVKKMDGVLDIGYWRLRVGLEKEGRQFGKLLFTLPEGWRAVEARVEGRRRRLTTVASGVVGLGLTLEGTATVEVDFRL